MRALVKILVVAAIGLALAAPRPGPRKPGGAGGPTPRPMPGGWGTGRGATEANLNQGAAGSATTDADIQRQLDEMWGDQDQSDRGGEDDAYDERDQADSDDDDTDEVDPNGTDQTNQQVADWIAQHADEDDRSIPGVPDDRVAEHLNDIMSVPGTQLRSTPSGTPRWAWWDPTTGTMIIREGNHGTFMQPSRGYEYYQEQVNE